MYVQEEKRERDQAEPERTRPTLAPLHEKTGENVRYSNVVQRHIVYGTTGFGVDRNRIGIDTMPVTPGMDRSHTISDRDVQNAVAAWMNQVVQGTANSDAFWNFCVNTAGEEAVTTITECITDLISILQKPLDQQQANRAVEIGNRLYGAVANSRFNLRPGNFSGNRSTGNYIDLSAPEIVDVLYDGAAIVIKITQVDAGPIDSMLAAGIKALVRVKAVGAVASSTNPKFPGASLTYEITTIEYLEDGFALAYARRTG